MSERTKEERAKFRRTAEHLRGTLVDCATMEPLGTDSLVDVAERLNEMGCLTVQAAPEITEAMVGEIETRLEEHELELYKLHKAVEKLWLESGKTQRMYYKNHYAALHAALEARKEGE